jgi:hypothetical protein
MTPELFTMPPHPTSSYWKYDNRGCRITVHCYGPRRLIVQQWFGRGDFAVTGDDAEMIEASLRANHWGDAFDVLRSLGWVEVRAS